MKAGLIFALGVAFLVAGILMFAPPAIGIAQFVLQRQEPCQETAEEEAVQKKLFIAQVVLASIAVVFAVSMTVVTSVLLPKYAKRVKLPAIYYVLFSFGFVAQVSFFVGSALTGVSQYLMRPKDPCKPTTSENVNQMLSVAMQVATLAFVIVFLFYNSVWISVSPTKLITSAKFDRIASQVEGHPHIH